MDKKIAILRGINVGGKRKILMADLKLLFENLGFKNVITYIQSGNVIFTCDEKKKELEISDTIESAISDKYGFDVPVIVRTYYCLEQAVNNNPFFNKKETDVNQLHLTLLKETPSEGNLQKLETNDYGSDQFKIDNKDVFVFCNGKYHQSKLTNNFFESKLKVTATTRNWKTVLKLLELSQ